MKHRFDLLCSSRTVVLTGYKSFMAKRRLFLFLMIAQCLIRSYTKELNEFTKMSFNFYFSVVKLNKLLKKNKTTTYFNNYYNLHYSRAQNLQNVLEAL